MSPIVLTVLLLIVSNIFMTFAWYGHLKNLAVAPWLIAVLVSWAIAFVEYLFQVPANRIGHTVLNLSQLKVLQEIITIGVFIPFAILYMEEEISLDFLWSGICLLGAAYFAFRNV